MQWPAFWQFCSYQYSVGQDIFFSILMVQQTSQIIHITTHFQIQVTYYRECKCLIKCWSSNSTLHLNCNLIQKQTVDCYSYTCGSYNVITPSCFLCMISPCYKCVSNVVILVGYCSSSCRNSRAHLFLSETQPISLYSRAWNRMNISLVNFWNTCPEIHTS